MEPYLGEIRLFPGNYAPVGWLFCNGSIVSIAENDALFTLLGTTYGGDGQTTFGLPDLRGRVVVSQTGSTYPLGNKGGVEQVTLNTAQLPVHNHSFNVSNANGTVSTVTNNFLAAPVDPTTNAKIVNLYLPTATPNLVVQPLLADTLSDAGGNQPHENRMPYLTINYIICTSGIYPNFQ
ncbi:phage tail protein [Mucilaginibacter sp. Bleaf8]|uniref:phage tail protein n=1 Tax=Mucilaginibacter sp. Bleaf8 TaxID=2834430 RepID=UPI001BCB2189|nr:tail fiber protein [Mucilaginibacter sp. Bleaf8]MBS7563834.1 phage tail protein [Mucilaginibacter sp. Bleaf8]